MLRTSWMPNTVPILSLLQPSVKLRFISTISQIKNMKLRKLSDCPKSFKYYEKDPEIELYSVYLQSISIIPITQQLAQCVTCSKHSINMC